MTTIDDQIRDQLIIAQQNLARSKSAKTAPQQGTGANAGREVVATAANGGKVYKMQDGSLAYSDDAYSTTDPVKIAEIMKGATAAETSTASFDQSTIAQHPGAAMAAKAVQGVPFAGQWADEAVGAISPAAGDAMRATNNAMDRQNPIGSAALQVAGGIAGAIPMAVAAAPSFIASGLQLPAKALLGGLYGAIAGGSEGIVSGAGRGEPGNRGETSRADGRMGVGFGGVTGAATPVVSKVASAGFDYVKRFWKASDIDTIMREFGISKKAAMQIKGDLAATDGPSAQRNLSIVGPTANIADASASTREALDSAITGGAQASERGKAAIYARTAAQGKRLDTTMNAILGTPEGMGKAASDIAKRTAPARKAYYDAAYDTPISYATGAPGEAILATLDRIDPKIVNSAIDKANALMRAEGIKNKQIMASVDAAGNVVYKEMPNVMQLDYIKRGLGAIGREVDTLGRATFDAGLASRQARELAAAVKAATGGDTGNYARALRLGGDKLQEDDALDIGRKIFTTSKESVANAMAGASVQAKAAARQGIREQVDDTISRVRRSIDDPNSDTTETRRLLSMLSSRDFRDKATLVLGQQKAGALFRELDSAGKMYGTMDAIAKGSQSASRLIRDDTLNDLSGPNAFQRSASLNPFKATDGLIEVLVGNTKAAQKERKAAILTDVANALITKQGPEAKRALAVVQTAIAGRPVAQAQAEEIGRLVAVLLAPAGYQAGTRGMPTATGGTRLPAQ